MRRAEDIGGQELSYAEVKAIASGNPAVLTLAEADAELQRLTLLKKNHLDEQFVARRSVRDLPGRISSLNERLANLTADEATAKQHADHPIIIGKHSMAQDDLLAVLTKRLEALPFSVREPTRIPIGTYRGLSFGVIVNPNLSPDVYLEGATTRTSGLSKEHQGPRAVLNALERIASGYTSEMAHVMQDASVAESQLRDYQARLGMPFTHEGYLSELTGLRDQLKAKLSASGHDSGEESGPTTADLAEQIKSLKASNTIEGTQSRTERKHSTAEEPITARIRRRREEADVRGEEGPPEDALQEPKAMSFQERILRERQQRTEGEGQSPQ